MKPIIEINHVWKQYYKGIDRKYKSFRDSIINIPADIFSGKKDTFWALNDIDFSVSPGESIGIIGRNGAGKSTLLKILSRITPPTKGEIVIRGKVASLLEVGTGFHPELTGKENIFFNGSILGMKYHEIKQKFDEIVAFSGVENFIETPLKHYSSGMQLRLAFSVAAHLNAEILLIDEVLAVGDAEFQKKCLNKIDDITSNDGKTIIFVSHDLPAMLSLCTRGIIIDKAKLIYDSELSKSISFYTDEICKQSGQDISSVYHSGNKNLTISGCTLKTSLKDNKIIPFNNLTILLSVNVKKNIKIFQSRIDVGINNNMGKRVAWVSSEMAEIEISTETTEILFDIKNLPLIPGEYDFNIYAEINHEISDWIKNVRPFTVHYSDYFNKFERIPSGQGDILLKCSISKNDK